MVLSPPSATPPGARHFFALNVAHVYSIVKNATNPFDIDSQTPAMDSVSNNRILIVDDNCAIHADFRRILGASPTADLDWAASEIFGDLAGHSISYELSFCTQGDEAVQAVSSAVASEKPFAIAFVDMRMPPGLDGVETIARMWQADPELQAVICTAYSDRSWEQIVGRLGRTASAA